MCFHSILKKNSKKQEKRFNAVSVDKDSSDELIEINGFTYPKTPVILNESPQLIQSINWGLIPSWSKDQNIRKFNLNARIETVDEKPSFKENIPNRCLIISSGFHEWKWMNSKGKSKEKYEITMQDQDYFAFAGIYSRWQNPLTSEVVTSYSILTTESNDLMSEIHHKKRMPVILNPSDESSWLKGAEFQSFSFPYEANLVAKNIEETLQGRLF